MRHVLGLLRLDKLGWSDVLDIALVALLIYLVFEAVRGTRASQMLLGMALLFVIFELTGALGLRTIHKILEHAFRYIPFVVIVVFQAEIRRALTALGHNPLLARWLYPARSGDDVFGEIAFAVTTLSSRRIGALIVIERSQRLKSYAEAGVRLDAVVSYDILVNIFIPDTPLHDGAVIVSDGRIVAASCFLPLTLQRNLSKQYGTRHRAAIGISEETDAIAIVVSETSGEVSLAVEGRLAGGLRGDSLLSKLRAIYAPPSAAPKLPHAARA